MGSGYVLMNMDSEVARFSSGKFEIYGKMPFGFPEDAMEWEDKFAWLVHWMEGRLKILCARNVDKFFNNIGIKNAFDAVGITNMVSLSDSFWVKREDSLLKWKDISPFRRNYSDAVSRFALDGVIRNNSKNYFSPVIGTNGSFPHTWKWVDKKIKFIKGSSKYTLGGANSGLEPYSEYYASLVGQYLKFDCVNYKIRNHRRTDGKIEVVTECECFNTEDFGSVAANTLGINGFEELIVYCKKLGKETYRKCIDMLFLDCLLLNTDRHMGNIEFIVDNRKVEVIGLRPIFDNNYSLLPRFMEDRDKFNREEYIARDGRKFEELYRLVMQHKSYYKELVYLRKLKFVKPENVSINRERLAFLNKFLKMQVKYLLEKEETLKEKIFKEETEDLKTSEILTENGSLEE